MRQQLQYSYLANFSVANTRQTCDRVQCRLESRWPQNFVVRPLNYVLPLCVYEQYSNLRVET